MCISTAQARTIFAPRGSRALGLWHFPSKFSHKRALVEIVLSSSLRGPCVILSRSSTEDLVEILVGSSLGGHCMRSLQMPCLRGACMKALVKSAPAAAGPSMRIL